MDNSSNSRANTCQHFKKVEYNLFFYKKRLKVLTWMIELNQILNKIYFV